MLCLHAFAVALVYGPVEETAVAEAIHDKDRLANLLRRFHIHGFGPVLDLRPPWGGELGSDCLEILFDHRVHKALS